MLGLLAGLNLVPGLLQGLGQGGLHLGDQLNLLEKLLLCLVLDQVIVDPALSVSQTITGNVKRTFSCLNRILKTSLFNRKKLYLRCLKYEYFKISKKGLGLENCAVNDCTHNISDGFLQLKFPQVDVLQPLSQPLSDLALGGVCLVHAGVDELLRLLPGVLRHAPDP